jgi:hypothetical protein
LLSFAGGLSSRLPFDETAGLDFHVSGSLLGFCNGDRYFAAHSLGLPNHLKFWKAVFLKHLSQKKVYHYYNS